jgi:hypothetical protein
MPLTALVPDCHVPAQPCRLQQTFGAVAAAFAPHLRLAQSEKALQAMRQLLRDAAALEQVQTTVWQLDQQRRQQLQGQAPAAGPQQPTAPATPKGDPALRAQSSTTVDSVDIPTLAATASAATFTATPAAATPEQPLSARILTLPRTAAHCAIRWLRSAVGISVRPAPEQARAPLQQIPSAKKAGKGKGEGADGGCGRS